jgi:hypothetical protein
MRHLSIYLLLIVIVSSLCLPAMAALPTNTYRGSVSAVQPGTANLTILATHRWGCSFENNTMTCEWIPISPMVLTGKVPDEQAFSKIKTGSTVEAVSIGSAGGTWIGLGLLVPDYLAGGLYATDLFGDIGSLPAPLISSYRVTAVTAPECGNCSGTRCTAASSAVTILRDNAVKANQPLLPGQTLSYEDQIDLSAASVTFVDGEASSSLCPNTSGGIGGIQPVSVYIVHVKPSPIGPIPTPQISTGTLAVASVPSGAVVILDGKELGLTPFSRPGLAPGRYSLLVEKDGYAPWEKNVTIFPAQYSIWTASLRSLYGSLSVRSSPSHASVTLDGSEVGYTPLTLSRISAGTHQVTVSKEGYIAEEREARVPSADITLLLVSLAHAPAESAIERAG